LKARLSTLVWCGWLERTDSDKEDPVLVTHT
jgi:hypothetical protein